ncbi:MAG: ABC transporter permease [Actinomycetota bacterium]
MRSRALFFPAAAVAAAALVPVGYLLLQIAPAPEKFAAVATEAATLRLLWRTGALAAGVAAACVVAGAGLAWLTVRTDLPGRKAWGVAACLPLVIPAYLGAHTYIDVAGPRGMLAELLGVGRLPSIYGYWGAWLVLTLFGYPLVLLPVRAALKGLDPALEEAAAGLGRGRLEAFRLIVLPALRPALGSGAVLVALYVFSDVGAVSLLDYDTLGRAIYQHFQTSLDRTGAIMLSGVLALAAAALLAGGLAGSRNSRRFASGSSRHFPALVPLGKLRWPAFAACAAVVLAGLGVPLTSIGAALYRRMPAGEPLKQGAATAAFLSSAAVGGLVLAVVLYAPVVRRLRAVSGRMLLAGAAAGGLAWAAAPRSPAGWTSAAAAFAAAFLAGGISGESVAGFAGAAARRLAMALVITVPLGMAAAWFAWGIRTGWLVWAVEVPNSLQRAKASAGFSLAVSGLGTVAAVAAAWPVALVAVRRPGKPSGLLRRLCFGGYFLPGVVVALSLALLGTRALVFFHQTVTLLVFAYVVLFLPQAVGALEISLLQVSPAVEEAARCLGAGRWRILRRVTAPLAGPGLAAGASMVFLTIMKELPATLLLSPAGTSTLGTEVWNATSEGLFSHAALPALGLIALSCVPLAILLSDETRHRYLIPGAPG